jgi:hypothetical protein
MVAPGHLEVPSTGSKPGTATVGEHMVELWIEDYQTASMIP